MIVIAVCFSMLCVSSPVASRDTVPLAEPETASGPPMSGADTVRAPRREPPPSDSIPEPTDPLRPRRVVEEPSEPSRVAGPVVARFDTLPARRRKKAVAVEYGDWYNRRLTIHRWASYATLPLFAGNYVTGQQLFDKGNQAPAWAIDAHGPLAASVATLFAVNTVTGGWNLWEGRHDPNGRKWRMAHAILMLTADAGFTTAGILADDAERSDSRRRLHRTVALTSIGVSLVSYAMMLGPLRRD